MQPCHVGPLQHSGNVVGRLGLGQATKLPSPPVQPG